MEKLRLDRIQKIAFSRIISDLIEADFIVEEGEMSYFEHIISKDGFNISDAMLVEAKRMTFAKAVAWLKELKMEQREGVIDALKQLSMSDGTCVPLEAIQIFALEQALEHDAQIYSIPVNDVVIDNMKAIYVESEDGTEVSKIVSENFRSLSNEFALAGFDLVLIPQIVSDFRRMSPAYLEKVVKYMIPSISESKVKKICYDLSNLTTSRFCCDLLDKKLDIPLADTQPALLIKISESDLVDQYDAIDTGRIRYMNFLQIKLGNDIVNQIRELIDHYRSMINCSIMVDSKPVTQKFRYYGFHRSLFELIAYSKKQREYRLIFNLSSTRLSIYFEPTDDSSERIPLNLNPQETALLYLIAKKSLKEGGLIWRSGHLSKHEKDAILEEYNTIYIKLSGGKKVESYDTQIKDRYKVSRIRSKIRSVNSVINKKDFLPEYDEQAERMIIHANINLMSIYDDV